MGAAKPENPVEILVSRFNPNQISAYYGGSKAWSRTGSPLKFQSESNLGLLWGAGTGKKDGEELEFQSESNLGLLWGFWTVQNRLS